MTAPDKMKFALDGCKRGIEQAQNNIKTFEKAIIDEFNTIASLREMQKDIIRKDMEREVIENDSTG